MFSSKYNELLGKGKGFNFALLKNNILEVREG